MGFLGDVRRRLARFSAHGIRSRALAFAFLAALVPLACLLILAGQSDGGAPGLTLPAVLAATGGLIALIFSLRPVSDLATLLDHYAGADERDGRGRDHHKRLLANVHAIATRLAAEERRARVHDVTGLMRRERLLTRIAEDLKARPQGPAMLGLVRVANYDQVRCFNQHTAERLLAAIGSRLRASTKANRPLAHIDRDCFAIWFTGDNDADASAELEALGYVLMQELCVGDLSLTPDVQLGSARYPIDAEEPGNLLNRAFVSLARPQRTTDGAIAFFARPSPQEARRRFQLEQDLRQAMRRGELTLHYQPVVDLAMGRVVGAEALLRWRSDRQHQSAPDEIIRIMEETGLVHEIGLWTLNTACRQLRGWCDKGLNGLKIAVNLSAHQLRDRALPIALERVLAAHGLAPSQIELELTETAAMEDAERTRDILKELRETGFSLAIDDFGSGYSSLAYLRRLPFQKLKIDREFVAQVDRRADSRTICKALIDLTAGLELSVLAEGVERFEEVETLRAMGCSTFQGYYFSKPLAPEDFLATVTDKDWLTRTSSRVHRERDELRRRLL